jgi:hypothetical protein
MLGYSPGGAAGPGNLPSLQNPPIPTPAQMGFRPPAVPSTGGAMPNPGEAADIRSSANAAAGLGDVGSLFVGGPVGRGLNYGLSLMDLLGGQAQAGERDPRAVRIDRLNAEIAQHRKTLEGFATKNFQSTAARQNASKPYLDAIAKAQDEAARLQGQMDDEATAQRQRETAEQASAKWRDTPLQKRYPELLPTTVGAGTLLGLAVGGGYGLSKVLNYNRRINDINTRWGDAVSRFQNTRLALDKRNAALSEARSLQNEYRQLVDEGAGFSSWTPAGTAFAGAEIGAGGVNAANYALGVPGSTEAFADPMTYGRIVGLGLPAAATGKLAGYGINAFEAHPTGYNAATDAAPQRFRTPRRR